MGIGKDGGLPWPVIKHDMKHFQSVTSSLEPLSKTVAQCAQDSILFNSALKQRLA